jgi:hypothetical protein
VSGVEIKGRVFIAGMNRAASNPEHLKTHLYDGTFTEPGMPLCQYGYDANGDYSIWRNNVSEAGICTLCRRRAEMGGSGVPFKPRKRKS